MRAAAPWWLLALPVVASLERLQAFSRVLRGEAPRPVISREDGVRVRSGCKGDAARIRELWLANDEARVAGPCSLMPAWSVEGIERSFAPRRAGGAFRATSSVAYDWSEDPPKLVGFAAANSPEEAYNADSTLPWRAAVDDGAFDPGAFVGPVCVAAEKRGSGLFRDLYAALLTSDDLADVGDGVTIIDAGNVPSLTAHARLPGCAEAGAFDHGGRSWVVFRFDVAAARAALSL